VSRPDPTPHSTLAYTPQLDGVRAIAIAAVVLYHGGISWAGGGFLGVDAFFVLSGFLITTLLVKEWQSRGSVSLRSFWLRRARRLLPALILMLFAVCAYAAFLAPPDQLANIRGDALSTLAYVANWHEIFANQGYFAQATDASSPLLHTWSLGIEEQFYLLWPLIVVALAFWRKSLRLCLVVASIGCAVSALEMALLFHPGIDPSRLYYGTDTRAQSLLMGAALALLLAVAPSASRPSAGKWLQPLGLVAAAAFVVMVVRVNSNTSAMYRGGFLLVALLVALVIWSIVAGPRTPLAAGLSLALVVYIGRISYGLYLWHWPADVVLDHARTGLSGWALFFLRTGVAVVLAVASYHLVEQPIRQRGLTGIWPLKRGTKSWAPRVVLAAVAATVTAILVSTIAPSTTPPPNALAAVRVANIPPKDRVRMLLVGDSMAALLGLDWAHTAPEYGVNLLNYGIVGCGLTDTGEVRIEGQAITDEQSPYFSQVKCGDWPHYWASEIDKFHPQVAAMLFGPFEVRDHLLNGKWVHIGMKAFDQLEVANLQKAVSVLSAGGAKVVFFTSPYYNQGEQPNGSPWPEDNPARVNDYNALLRKVAASHPRTVKIIDLGGYLSPGGHYASVIRGVAVRPAGDVHVTTGGAAILAPLIFPQIVKDAQG
jgi:peptidoglycan/LPS O-acetylase OafA/YrhL